MSDNIYIPPGVIRLDTQDYNFQLRLGIEGLLGTGKTHSACTFPNPIVLSYDRGLISHIGRKDVSEVPFYNAAFIDSLVKRESIYYTDLRNQVKRLTPPNRKDALPKWLYTEAVKLTRNQTLVVDGGTGIQAAYHMQYWTSPSVDKDGCIKPYEEFRMKIDYFTEIMMALKALQCDVIYLCHESQDRDAKGNLNGQIRPLLSGQFVDELGSHFTDWFRAVTIEKPPTPEKLEDMKKAFGLNALDAKNWIESTPQNVKTIYLWQTQSDSLVKCKTSMIGAPKYVIANASVFSHYRRKQEEISS